MSRANPAASFMAKTLAEKATGKPWKKISQRKRLIWSDRASHLLIEMYSAGFNVPMPNDPDAIWERLSQ